MSQKCVFCQILYSSRRASTKIVQQSNPHSEKSCFPLRGQPKGQRGNTNFPLLCNKVFSYSTVALRNFCLLPCGYSTVYIKFYIDCAENVARFRLIK